MSTNKTVVTETDAVMALVDSAVTAWKDSLSSTRRSVEAAAVATFAAKPFIGGDAALWADVDAYRENFPALTGEGFISKSYVTLLARLGKCHALGITPETDPQTWGRLVQKANSDKRIRVAVDGDKDRDGHTTKTAIVKAVKSAYPGGKYAKETADAPADAEHGNQSESGDNVTAPASVSAALDMLEMLALRLATEPITPAEYKRLADVVETLSEITPADVETVEASRAS